MCHFFWYQNRNQEQKQAECAATPLISLSITGRTALNKCTVGGELPRCIIYERTALQQFGIQNSVD